MEIREGEHTDPTAEISLETIKSRSVKGVVTLTGRYFVLYIVTAIAQIFLGAFLNPGQFGIFGIVSAFKNFLVYFSDIGLAASLIQKKEKLESADLKTSFTVQQVLVFGLLIVLVLSSSRIKSFYNLSNEGIILLYALGFSFLLSSLRTIPTVLLERSLSFEKIAIVNVLENVVYNCLLVLLAWKGLGINSFTIAVAVQALVGFVAIYSLSPWRPGIGISFKSLRKLLSFGIPYQVNTFIALIKDDGLTLVLGKIIGLDAMGFLIWAQKWVQMPLRIIMDTVTKVTFPAFARMQDKIKDLERSVSRSIFFITFLVFPATIGLVILAPVLVKIIPQYQKWTPALIPLAILSINSLFASFTTQLTNLLNAIGKIKITFVLMVMWALLTWILVPALGFFYGVNGVAWGYALVGTSSLVAVYLAKRYVNFSIYDSILKPLLATVLMASVLLILRGALPEDFYSVWILASVGVIVYGVLMVAIIGASLIEDAKKSFKTFFSR